MMLPIDIVLVIQIAIIFILLAIFNPISKPSSWMEKICGTYEKGMNIIFIPNIISLILLLIITAVIHVTRQ